MQMSAPEGETTHDPANNYPFADYLATSVPSAELTDTPELRQFFSDGFAETRPLEYQGRRLAGPFILGLRTALEPVDKLLRTHYPDLSPRALENPFYHDDNTRAELAVAFRNMKSYDVPTLYSLRQARAERTADLADSKILPMLQGQTLNPGLLKCPPYLVQRNTPKDQSALTIELQGCANACFRMVCADVLGVQPAPKVVARACQDTFGSHVISNLQYLNFFHSAVMREKTGQQITTIDVVGADFGLIGQIAQVAGRKWPGSAVYCTLQLSSAGVNETATHQVVLLGADTEAVYFHDPSDIYGGAAQALDKRDFARRWAHAFNEAMLVISWP